ncbi:MAG: glycosyl transferase [Sporocytophaga sp.]|uniref:glycosyltransferase family protein n=1 Tax=Sporocytophaga sp. TaxID=2231183 RepID=UPI001B1E4A20|nr:glycosyltransferase family protein [Sporocytophaga sp.]MBO9698973.1 glycosyl transferase [Sporocytophaga sp.]
MRILYAIQGTGNGHLSRARDIVPILQSRGELDILVSGIQADVSLPYPVKYKFQGLSFIFGKSGGVDLINTYLKNNSKKFFSELRELPIEKYDVVINDFEPVSAWACHLKKKPCIALSHQSAVLSPKVPKPGHTDHLGSFILKRYAPATHHYGFHFEAFDENIFTPVIRKEVREIEPSNNGHYTVYLPAYNEERLIKVLSKVKDVKWEVFSKHSRKPWKEKNLNIKPINNEAFIKSMASSEGVLCGAGFETPAEALYLGKKLMVIPMKNQYEQHYNAAALMSMGIPVIKALKKKHLDTIGHWVGKQRGIKVEYPDITESIIDKVLENAICLK